MNQRFENGELVVEITAVVVNQIANLRFPCCFSVLLCFQSG